MNLYTPPLKNVAGLRCETQSSFIWSNFISLWAVSPKMGVSENSRLLCCITTWISDKHRHRNY